MQGGECCPKEAEPMKLSAIENPVSPQHCDPNMANLCSHLTDPNNLV